MQVARCDPMARDNPPGVVHSLSPAGLRHVTQIPEESAETEIARLRQAAGVYSFLVAWRRSGV